jgi:hypothetical protein
MYNRHDLEILTETTVIFIEQDEVAVTLQTSTGE